MATQEAPPQLSGIEIAPATPPQNPPSVHEPAVRPWELELLLSLSLVFALMQLPAQVDAVFNALEPQLDEWMQMAAFAVYQGVKLPLYLVIGAFLLHLAARAYWVGLIGLEAVFPAGVRWDSLPYGPVSKEEWRPRVGSLQPMIDRADRFGSIIFSSSLALVATFAFGLVFTAAAGGLAFAASSLFLGGEYMGRLYGAALLLLALPSAVVKWVDQRYGARWPEGSAARKWLRRGATLSFYASGGSAILSVWLILSSNLSRRVVSTTVALVFTSLFAFFLVKDVLVRKGAIAADGYAYLPEGDGPRSMDAAYYESLRPGGESYDRSPSIPSDVVEGPYLRLFLPYSPERMNAALRTRCPGLPELGGSGVRIPMLDRRRAAPGAEERVLACWARLQPVKLNGVSVQPSFRFFTHPQTGVRGVVAYLPTAPMARGENVLEVGAVPRAGKDPLHRPAPRPHLIPFWR